MRKGRGCQEGESIGGRGRREGSSEGGREGKSCGPKNTFTEYNIEKILRYNQSYFGLPPLQ